MSGLPPTLSYCIIPATTMLTQLDLSPEEERGCWCLVLVCGRGWGEGGGTARTGVEFDWAGLGG